MSRTIKVLCLSVLAVCVTAPSLWAAAKHPISVTEAQVFVTRNSARMRIKLYAEDLYMFQGLEPDDVDVLPADELRRGLEQHRSFLLEKVTLRGANGDAFPGRVTDLQSFEIPDEGIPVADLMMHTATYELEYTFETPPEFLTIQQDISDENFIVPSEMKLTLHQAGSELTYTESLKPGAAETLRFDWSEEQLTSESSEADWEAWFEKQREATLGITSYSSVYSFVYIEPTEVRHEVLIPLASLMTILPMEHKDPAFVDVEEQDGVRQLIRDWLVDVNPATINGIQVKPEFTRIDFYGLDLRDFAKQAEARRVSLANGRVGVIMTYRPAQDFVREANLTWDKFHSSIRKIQSVIIAYPNELQRFEFSRFNKPEDNIFHWAASASVIPESAQPVVADFPAVPQLSLPIGTIILGLLGIVIQLKSLRSLSRPALALLSAAIIMWPFVRVEIRHPFRSPPAVAEQDASRVFESLHRTAYQALDFGTERRIYDVLETAVDGELLETTYLQLRESLAMREQGGAIARVQSVKYDDGAAVNPQEMAWPGFQFRSRWTVSGTVEHWGHVHERQNHFCALFSIEPRKGHWKITDMQIEEQKSVAKKPRLRKF